MNVNKKTSLISMPRNQRPICRFQNKIGGCRNVNCLFRHEKRTPYPVTQVNKVKCEPEEAKKLKEILEQPDFFSRREFSNENRRPKTSFVSQDSAYRKTNIPQKEELKNELREKKRKLEEFVSVFEKDIEAISKKAKTKNYSALEQWQSTLKSLENLHSNIDE